MKTKKETSSYSRKSPEKTGTDSAKKGGGTRKDLTNARYHKGRDKQSGTCRVPQKKDTPKMKSELESNRRLKRGQGPQGVDSERVKARNGSPKGFQKRDIDTSSMNVDVDERGFIQVASEESLVLYNRKDIESYSELLNHYFGILEVSEASIRTFDQICDRGWTFQFDDIGNGGYFIDADNHTIWLDQYSLDAKAIAKSDYFYASAMMNLLRGLRDAWQESRWKSSTITYHPESLLMLEKMRTADSDVVAVIFAKELQEEGYDVFMRHLLASDDAFLARYFINDDHLLKVQAASAFRSWFLEPKRVDTTDHETLCYLDTVLEDAGHGNPFGRNRLTPIEIVRMGCLPDGTSYLAGYGEAVLRDPVFAGLSDPINQAHYFHLVRDMEAYFVNGVPFRSPRLASKIFPEQTTVIQD